eukprot:scaffold285725_cov29-Tisochrysis_lutea.AAC.4
MRSLGIFVCDRQVSTQAKAEDHRRVASADRERASPADGGACHGMKASANMKPWRVAPGQRKGSCGSRSKADHAEEKKANDHLAGVLCRLHSGGARCALYPDLELDYATNRRVERACRETLRVR